MTGPIHSGRPSKSLGVGSAGRKNDQEKGSIVGSFAGLRVAQQSPASWLPRNYNDNIMIIMARYSSEHKAETRRKILGAADRVMKARGVEAASVEAVMREAGLTVGGFYAHFPSKDALAHEALLAGLEQSVDRLLASLAEVPDGAPWVRALIRRYLAQADESSLDRACPLTLFLPDVARGGRDFQNAVRRAHGRAARPHRRALSRRSPA